MANRNDLSNIRIISCGLSDGERINSGGTSWVETINNEENKNIIQFRTLDDLVELGEIPEKIGYIHLDVEGMEDKAINGASKTIQTYYPILSLEDHDVNNYKLDEILNPMGYIRIDRKHSNNIYIRKFNVIIL